MLKDSKPNWFIANASTAFMFQGHRIPKDNEIVLPDGDFFITYLYHEPKDLDEEDIPATLTSEWLENSDKAGIQVSLSYSMEKDTVFKVQVEEENNEVDTSQILSAKTQSIQTLKFNTFPKSDRFRLKFLAFVSYSFPFGAKVFLNQVAIQNVKLDIFKKVEFKSQNTGIFSRRSSFSG